MRTFTLTVTTVLAAASVSSAQALQNINPFLSKEVAAVRAGCFGGAKPASTDDKVEIEAIAVVP